MIMDPKAIKKFNASYNGATPIYRQSRYKLHLKKTLEKEKTSVEKQLKSFAKKDPRLKGDYDTRYPDLGTHQSVDEMAQEVSMYESSLPVEHVLELKLRDIDIALDKIKKGTYGICENCEEKIPEERLETKPEAKYCTACRAKINKEKRHT